MVNRLKDGFKFFYHQLVDINDTPHRKALGLSVGVFLGIFPGLGPLAALAVSFVFRINRAAALLGSLATNTWISILTFVLAVKIGSLLTGENWHQVYEQCRFLLKNFKWKNFFDVSVMKVFGPLLIGYTVIGLAAAVAVYFVAIFFLLRRKNN